MKKLLLVIPIILSSCSLFDKPKESPISGHWVQFELNPHIIGECCGLSLHLEEDNEQVTGFGTVETPGLRMGDSQSHSVAIGGGYDGEVLSINLHSGSKTAVLEASFVEGMPYDMIASFDGFGISSDQVPLSRADD